MDYQQLFAISASGMGVQRRRVEVAALNLSQADIAQAPGRHIYQPLRVVLRTVTGSNFGDAFQHAAQALPAAQVEVAGLPPKRAHEPGHPAADAEGFVSYANVDTIAERLDMLRATRAYEANLAAFSMSRTLVLKTLDLGGRG